MESRIPLYSRRRPLKNLISDYTKANNISSIVIDTDSMYEAVVREVELSDNEKALYKAFVKHWYFSDIGFDSDDEFIYRFNAVWESNIRKYVQLYESIIDNGYSYERKTTDFVTKRTGDDTLKRTGSGQHTVEKTGDDTFEKGVITTSTQETSNTGNKLGRSTPTEELKVAGDSTTTVEDSGSDVNRYNTTETTVDTPNYENKQEYNSTFDNKGDEVREMLTPNELNKIYNQKSVLLDFALCFEKLFMEVF